MSAPSTPASSIHWKKWASASIIYTQTQMQTQSFSIKLTSDHWDLWETADRKPISHSQWMSQNLQEIQKTMHLQTVYTKMLKKYTHYCQVNWPTGNNG